MRLINIYLKQTSKQKFPTNHTHKNQQPHKISSKTMKASGVQIQNTDVTKFPSFKTKEYLSNWKIKASKTSDLETNIQTKLSIKRYGAELIRHVSPTSIAARE